MQLTNELGQEIIKRLAEYIDVDINIMNLDGNIVASTDESRINELHSGAVEVLKMNESLILNEESTADYPGTKPGVNFPIMHQNKMSGVVGVSGEPDSILRITGLIRASVEMVIEQIYTQRQAYYEERQWNNWLHQLLHPSGYNEEKLAEDAAYSLNINTESLWSVIILNGANVQDALDNVRRELINSKIDALFTLPFADDEIVMTVSSGIDTIGRLAERLSDSEYCIGVGGEAFGMKGIRQSYQQAEQALIFNGGKEKVTYSENWKIERLIASISTDEYNSICSAYEQRLDAIGKDYVQTIDTYFDKDSSIKGTAEKLHIHRNTLLYRLDQVREKVGLDPRVFHDAFLLKVIRSKKKI